MTSDKKKPTNLEGAKPSPKEAQKKRLPSWRPMAAGLILLVSLYYASGLILTEQIKARYTGRDCAAALKLGNPTQTLYPAAMAPFVTPALAQLNECRAYTAAAESQAQAAWANAYAGYRLYLDDYPEGLFVSQAREGAAQSLLALADEQEASGAYGEGTAYLLIIANEFGGTTVADEAKSKIPAAYMRWGKSLRADGQFAEAEAAFQSLQQWASAANDAESVRNARLELAQTYLEWARELQVKKSFAEAEAKYQQAAAADPQPQSSNSPSAQVNAALYSLYQQWGDDLITEDKYEEAIGHYRQAITYAAAQDVTATQDALARGYLKWAEALSAEEDYLGALDQIDLAEGSATDAAAQSEAQAARASVLEAFAHSSGAQAQNLMDEAAAFLCNQGKPLEGLPPILGIEADTVRVRLHGTPPALSTDVVAQTPATMHYVACGVGVTISRRIESCTYATADDVKYYIERWRYYWSIELRDVETGKVYKTREIGGKVPHACPDIYAFAGNFKDYYYGEEPEPAELEAWLRTLVK